MQYQLFEKQWWEQFAWYGIQIAAKVALRRHSHTYLIFVILLSCSRVSWLSWLSDQTLRKMALKAIPSKKHSMNKEFVEWIKSGQSLIMLSLALLLNCKDKCKWSLLFDGFKKASSRLMVLWNMKVRNENNFIFFLKRGNKEREIHINGCYQIKATAYDFRAEACHMFTDYIAIRTLKHSFRVIPFLWHGMPK